MTEDVRTELDAGALDQLFRAARTHSAWLDGPVTDDQPRRIYDLMKWGPTSANSSPARIVFLRSRAAKERLAPALAPQNVDKWAMEDFGGFSIATYPTMNGIFNCSGTYNIGSYCDKKADQLISASTGGSDPTAVKAEADYLTLQQPGLFQPVVDNVMVWKKTISGPPDAFASLTQYQLNPEFWYFTKKS